MDKLDKQALQVAKEITVKFIEMGRISPTNFTEHFQEIYAAVQDTVAGRARPAARAPEAGEPDEA